MIHIKNSTKLLMFTQTCLCAKLCIHAHAATHARVQAHTHAHVDTRIHKHTQYMHTRVHIQAHKHNGTHRLTRTQEHKHTETLSQNGTIWYICLPQHFLHVTVLSVLLPTLQMSVKPAVSPLLCFLFEPSLKRERNKQTA